MTAERTNHVTGLPGVADAEVARLTAQAISILLSGKALKPSIQARLDLLGDAFLSDRAGTWHDVLLHMRQAGIPVDDIIDVIIPEVARNAGQRWMDDEISFADVTIVTARLQETVRALGRVPRQRGSGCDGDVRAAAKTGPRVLMIIPRPEEHTLGAFVAADQFRRHGCRVDIAMDLHPRQIAETVRRTRYHMVGITAAGRRTLASTRELVDTVKASVTRVTPVVLGGSSVEGTANLKGVTGVDHVVRDVRAALGACGLALGSVIEEDAAYGTP